MENLNSEEGKEMHAQIKKFSEFGSPSEIVMDVMISYDCSGDHKPFREKLRAELMDKYGLDFINESLYLLKTKLNDKGKEDLKSEIKVLFEKLILENKNLDNVTTVHLISPFLNELKTELVIKYP